MLFINKRKRITEETEIGKGSENARSCRRRIVLCFLFLKRLVTLLNGYLFRLFQFDLRNIPAQVFG